MATSTEFGATPPTSEQQMNMFRLRDKMCLLNAEFLRVLNGFYAEKNHYDFTGTMKSYMQHVHDLKTMYRVDDASAVSAIAAPSDTVTKIVETKPLPSGETTLNRKIAKAVRRNGAAKSTATDSPKIANSTVFAASSPAAAMSVPKFGDISVIAKETPLPLEKSADPPAPAASATARKRAIRGGGPLGGSESVIFKSGSEPQAATSTVNIPTTTIKFPEPSKDFWTKKDTNAKDGTAAPPNNGGSLFAFLGKDGDKAKEPTKFSGFSFGKKPDAASGSSEENAGKSTSGSPPEKNEPVVAKPAGTSLFGGITKAPATSTSPFGSITKAPASSTTPTKPLTFGEPKKEETAGTKPFSALSFGASLFGSSAPSSDSTKTTAPALSFGSGSVSGSGSLFSGFAGLAQKAVDNQAKPEGGDDEEEYVPPKVETVEAEEPDAVITSKVAVFKFSGKEYTKLGVGMLHVKDTDGKFSVLIRAATATGTVWLNALCNKTMKATKVDDKGEKIRLTCPTSKTEMVTMMIRFGTADGAKKFMDKLEEVSK